MIAKRALDLALAVPGLILLSPVFAAIALWVRWDTPGPVFFRQTRVGRGGRHFRIYKFRTMAAGGEGRGLQVTAGVDPRITRAGRFLREHKLDELPQLINVVKGEMSLVGPRPEVPEYVAHYPEDLKAKILSIPPGITDRASLEFRDESALLADAADPRTYYVEQILPHKLAYYVEYVEHRTLWLDLRLIFRTLGAVLR